MVALWHYKSTPGPQGAFPPNWPVQSTLRREAGSPTLLVFLHPRCPCSRATISELSRLITLAPARLRVQVVFHLPEGEGDAFAKTELWQRARELTGVDATIDRGGAETRRFGAATSGQTLLYGADGTLQFAGGITVARGHEGRSPGMDRILALASGKQADRPTAPVFGCAL
jgi:hypothetical protein